MSDPNTDAPADDSGQTANPDVDPKEDPSTAASAPEEDTASGGAPEPPD